MKKYLYQTLRLCAFAFKLFLMASQSPPLEADYSYNPHVPVDVWTELEPYFLPENHSLKARLDRLFNKKRISETAASLEKAGFGKILMRQPTNLVIGRSIEIDGYILKIYLDSQPPVQEWTVWLRRIRGAQSIRDCVARHHFRDCVVPRKWIYPLPINPSPSRQYAETRKNFILVVEDMRILTDSENIKAYRSKIKTRHLDQIYTILNEEGLIDSMYPDNIPFTRDGKIAFIDTEHSQLQPVNFQILTPFLSPKMQSYWNSLIQQ